MKKSILYIIVLGFLNIVGLALSVTEGSPYFWANFVGLFLFGTTSYLLGLFNDPYHHKK